MKVIIGIDLDDSQRDVLADWLDGKTSKRLATRKDVVDLVDSLVMGITDSHAAGCQAGAPKEENFDWLEAPDGMPAPAHIPKWEEHPVLRTFAAQIAAGADAHGYHGQQLRSYRRGWTLSPTGGA